MKNDFIKIKTNVDFLLELKHWQNYFPLNSFRTKGMEEIKNRIDEIFDIVFNNKTMIYLQQGYSNLRPFVDCYQEAIDFFKTENGERVSQVFSYFGYNYEVLKKQKGGYNLTK